MKKYNLFLLKNQCGDDKLFFNEMLDVFIRSAQEGITNMEEGVLTKDLLKLGHYAHKILSPFKLIQAEDLCVYLKEIESGSDTRQLTFERAGFLLHKIKTETEELIKELESEYE